MVSRIIANMVRTMRKPDARFCLDTVYMISLVTRPGERLTVNYNRIILFILLSKCCPFGTLCPHLFSWRQGNSSLHKLKHILLCFLWQLIILVTAKGSLFEEILNCSRHNNVIAIRLLAVCHRMAEVPLQMISRWN